MRSVFSKGGFVGGVFFFLGGGGGATQQIKGKEFFFISQACSKLKWEREVHTYPKIIVLKKEHRSDVLIWLPKITQSQEMKKRKRKENYIEGSSSVCKNLLHHTPFFMIFHFSLWKMDFFFFLSLFWCKASDMKSPRVLICILDGFFLALWQTNTMRLKFLVSPNPSFIYYIDFNKFRFCITQDLLIDSEEFYHEL